MSAGHELPPVVRQKALRATVIFLRASKARDEMWAELRKHGVEGPAAVTALWRELENEAHAIIEKDGP